ncbi:MAG: carbohydrate binding domain-containing protein [Armatimonadota bacterium]
MMRVVIAITLAALMPVMCVAQDNLVENGGFEDGFEGWITDVIVGPVEFIECPEVVHSGELSMLMTMPEDGRGIARSPAFEVEPGQSYDVSVWATAEGAAEDMVYARVHWWKTEPGVASDELVKSDTERAGGTFDWTELTATVTAPADANKATVRLETGGDTGLLSAETEGPFWVRFDDLVVTPAE